MSSCEHDISKYIWKSWHHAFCLSLSVSLCLSHTFRYLYIFARSVRSTRYREPRRFAISNYIGMYNHKNVGVYGTVRILQYVYTLMNQWDQPDAASTNIQLVNHYEHTIKEKVSLYVYIYVLSIMCVYIWIWHVCKYMYAFVWPSEIYQMQQTVMICSTASAPHAYMYKQYIITCKYIYIYIRSHVYVFIRICEYLSAIVMQQTHIIKCSEPREASPLIYKNYNTLAYCAATTKHFKMSRSARSIDTDLYTATHWVNVQQPKTHLQMFRAAWNLDVELRDVCCSTVTQCDVQGGEDS